MNSWTNSYYHTPNGRILGSIVLYGDRYKAMVDNLFIGWFITEDYAKIAVESAHKDGVPVPPIDRSIKAEYIGARYAKTN